MAAAPSPCPLPEGEGFSRGVVGRLVVYGIIEERCPVVSPRPLSRRIRLEVKLPRLARRAATVPERGDMDGADDAALRQRDDVADAYRMTRLRHRSPGDCDGARFAEPGGEGTALRQAGEPQPFVEPQARRSVRRHHRATRSERSLAKGWSSPAARCLVPSATDRRGGPRRRLCVTKVM